MTTQEIVDYYVNLLIIQYHEKPKAQGFIDTIVTPVIMDQVPDSVLNGFDLETAVGVQLDTIGKYVGASRYGYNFTGPMTLNDTDFRQFIKICIVQNGSGSSLYEIQQLLHTFFPGTLLVYDYQDMRMSYLFDASIGSVQLAEFFIEAHKIPKPMGVQLSSLIYAPSITNVFAFRTYAVQPLNVKGFNSYSNYQTNWPWLTYDNVIIL